MSRDQLYTVQIVVEFITKKKKTLNTDKAKIEYFC